MKLRITLSLIPLVFLSATSIASDGIWTSETVSHKSSVKIERPGHYYRADIIKLQQTLSRAEYENQPVITGTIDLPVGNGEIQTFSLQESPIMAPELAAKFPEIKTYKIYGVDNPYAGGRLSLTPKGFHGMIISPQGTAYIDPEGDDYYRAWRKGSVPANKTFSCGVTEAMTKGSGNRTFSNRIASRPTSDMRVYRLALAATYEYFIKVGGTVSTAMAAMVVAINRVNGVYERDLGIQLEFISQNDRLIYTYSNDPYTNSNEDDMISENQTNIDRVIGSGNYDIGHVFGTARGSVAFVGSVCTSDKAKGVSNSPDPTGDEFYIDYVAHEIGHQFNARHSFNGSACSGRSASSAVEPGSGSTIMAYAGVCGAENIAANSIATFHAHSIEEINSFVLSGAGNSCGDSRAVLNNQSVPSVNAGSDIEIPANTPFVLTGSGSDADADTLSYSWDQMDANGTATTSGTLGTDLVNNPLMQSLLPSSSNSRSFPKLSNILNNVTDKAETLPTTTRNLNFRLTVRDGLGGVKSDDMQVSVTATAGPFAITSHTGSPSLSANTDVTVEWNTANTDIVPISCASVDISLLMFNSGKTTYSIHDLGSFANSGSQLVTLPNLNIQKARFKVACSDGRFYALSVSDIKITGGATTASVSDYTVDPDAEEHGAVSPNVAAPSGGGGALNFWWLLSLLSLVYYRKGCWTEA